MFKNSLLVTLGQSSILTRRTFHGVKNRKY